MLSSDPVSTHQRIPLDRLFASDFSTSIYGDTQLEIDDLIDSVREHGILVPVVVVQEMQNWEIISGHRRVACARKLGFDQVLCEVRVIANGAERERSILEFNKQRKKTFSQLMREADALERILGAEASTRRHANLRQNSPERRNSDSRDSRTGKMGRTDEIVAQSIGIGGKDIFRQARIIWEFASRGDTRAISSVNELDSGTKTVHAAHKDLRRRDQFGVGFKPTPYDVWSFRQERAFGISHPGSIPASIIAHLLHYYSSPGDLIVDPTAGGGTSIDVCQAMGRRCLAYDVDPRRSDIQLHDIRLGFPQEASGATLIFCDPPYHTMLKKQYKSGGISDLAFEEWENFLFLFTQHSISILQPGGLLALLLANQTEKDLPEGHGYIDHVFYGYQACCDAGFLPERRISCPMSSNYLPQDVRRARIERRMLGQVRDLLIMRKPPEAVQSRGSPPASS